MRIVMFCHSLISDWNHGNAHFLRGIAVEMLSRGCEVRVFEPRDSWSLSNLLRDQGPRAVSGFHAAYPTLSSLRYDARRLDIDLLLWRLRDHPDLAAFVDRAIGPLRDHDERSRPPLLPTLETYLAHAGRKAETARELHLNRQTLYNRQGDRFRNFV